MVMREEFLIPYLHSIVSGGSVGGTKRDKRMVLQKLRMYDKTQKN